MDVLVKFLIFALLINLGCVQEPNSKRATGKALNSQGNSTKNSDTKVPTFSDSKNFIQNGPEIFTSIVNLEVGFSDALYLRGKEIDSFIRSNGVNQIVCLTARFTQSSINKVVAIAAMPNSIYNFSTQTLEYYFNLFPNDLTQNQNFCQKAGLINQLFALYPTLTPKYKLSDICPTGGSCLNSEYASQPLVIYTSGGVALTQLNMAHLLFNIKNIGTTTSHIGSSCTENISCITQGYHCCSQGQCVKDLSVKPGVDTASTGYLQAVQDILNNPANIYQYPQYYFICSESTVLPTPTPTSTNSVGDALLRLEKLNDLYNCTHKIEGEYGVCTYREADAALNTFYPDSTDKYFYDDRSFSSTFSNISYDSRTLVSIEEIRYGGVVIFDYTTKTEAQLMPIVYEDSNVRIEGIHNDDLDTSTLVKVKAKPSSAISNELIVRYKVDASCNPISSNLAKCEKYYIQGQENSGDTNTTKRRGRVTDHYTDSNVFLLPYYANTSKAITVQVDGAVMKEGIDWELKTGATNYIQFLPSTSLQVFKNQKVLVTFFVELKSGSTVIHRALDSKLKALNEIKTMCSCSDLRCNLSPVKDSTGKINDYSCVYPDPDPVTPPMSQKVYLSSKAVPVRYFDSLGVGQKSVSASTLSQEGTAFKYRNGNYLNPNNITDINNPSDTSDTYIGFNEIYGSLSYTSSSAKPALEVAVKKGVTYDIYVDKGTYANCLLCGNDYYSTLNRLFPQTQFGSGLTPILTQTNRFSTSVGVRADDLAFGRACLLPATMIPWAHHTESTEQEQRLNRLSAQHFLFANGYQKDWYGFDYGSIIGSFDGVRWFSIGTNRRIKADTNKLFLAVNGIFGDLVTESTYEVTINDGSLNPTSTLPTQDDDSDGAQCRNYHKCNNDNDCVATLGWDYACTSISDLTSSWPVFDDNGKEIPESSRDDNRLMSIFKISGSSKRCVYRGRGSPCTGNYSSVNINSTFNGTTERAHHACSMNNYCQSIAPFGSPALKFNNRITRFGKVKTDATVDSFGLGARIQGRPYRYEGEEAIRSQSLRNLNANKTAAVCLPGHEVDLDNFEDQNKTTPTNTEYGGDKIIGIGSTLRKNTASADNQYLMSCSVMDEYKRFYHLSTDYDPTDSISANTTLKYDSAAQNISTNALNIFNSIFSSKGITFGIYKSSNEVLTTMSYLENKCLRAPGASCFTDQDCAPSKTISDKIMSLNPDDSVVSAALNKYEVKFWQEPLICSQATEKTSTSFDPRNNRCCRDVNKKITLPSADSTNGIDMTEVPGIDHNLTTNNRYRYSRASTMYKETKTDPTTYPELRVAIKDQCTAVPSNATCASTAILSKQYLTFAKFAEKTSCTGDWVRTFYGGTHRWEASRFQAFNSSMFKCFNWLPNGVGATCEGLEDDDPSCGLVQTSPTSLKAKGVFSYLGRLELMGIPQIALEAYPYFNSTTEQSMSCLSEPNNTTNTSYPGPNYKPPPELFESSGKIYEYSDGNTPATFYYSGIDETNFISIKKIFSSDEIVTCKAAGTQMKTGDDPNLCCTGMINSVNNKCQMPDYVDLSIYTNRYVSSEAKKLSVTLFDTYGYVKDPSYVTTLACEKKICASGYVAYGVLISKLKTPGQIASNLKHYRFLENTPTADNIDFMLDLFNKGLKLNNHAYCIPAGLATSSSATEHLTIINCGL